MPSPVRIKIAGLRELDAALGEMTKATARNTLIRVGKAALEPMAEVARSLAPDDPETGGNDLHRSINVGTQLTPRQRRLAAREPRDFATVYVGTADPSGIFQEFGTVNHGPQAFMRPAFAREAQGTIDRVAKGLKPEIDKSAARARARALKKAK